MTNQIKMLPDGEASIQKDNGFNHCRQHPYAISDIDFIEVTIKKTGKKVIRCRYCERRKIEDKKIRAQDLQKEKETLADSYVLRTLTTGKNSVKKELIPPELIEAKRALLQIKNLKEEMEKPLKTCSKHGKLFRDAVIKSGKSRYTGEPQWKCKQCMKELHKKHYELNKVKVLEKHKEWRKSDPEHVRDIRYRSWKKNKEKYLLRENARREKYRQSNQDRYALREIRRVTNLEDSYVRKTLTNHGELRGMEIPQELIDAKRAILMLKRGIKQTCKENTIIKLEEKLDVEN